MSSGTVGYTDTRGNKDYLSIIANQVGKRLKQSSDMAAEERAFAEEQAEAGGTSLSEAGIGRGYFFKRALGSRFGGDRIARTRGRLSSNPGAARNPAGTFKSRFRGGFDYKVTNQNITDTVPLSNALVTGLRGVQGGLIQVSQAISRQDSSIDSLAQTQADMAKAIMFNGYLFQMFMSQNKARKGRSSLAREERAIERGGYRRGGGGFGGGFGGGGGRGGRGMINVTPSGTNMARRSASSAGGTLGPAGALIGAGTSSYRQITGAAMDAGRILPAMLKGTPYFADSAGSIIKMMGQGPDVIAKNVAKKVGGSPNLIAGLGRILTGGLRNPFGLQNTMSQALTVLGPAFDATTPRAKMLSAMFAGIDAKGISSGLDTLMTDAMVRFYRAGGNTTQGAAKLLEDATMGFGQKGIFKLSKDFGIEQAEIFAKLGFAELADDAYLRVIAEKFPGVAFKNPEEAIALTEIVRLMDNGVPKRKAVDTVRRAFGSGIDDVLIRSGETALKNTTLAKAIGKGTGKAVGKSMLKRIITKIPVVAGLAGVVFGIQRALEGDLFGAGLEIASGLMGATGVGGGFGLAIDGYLLGRDLGAMPMANGAVVYKNKRGKGQVIPMANGAFKARVAEAGSDELVAPLDDRVTNMFGLGFVRQLIKNKTELYKILGFGTFQGITDAASGGVFDFAGNIADAVGDAFNGIKEWFQGIFDNIMNALKGLNPAEWFKNVVPGLGDMKNTFGDAFNNIKGLFSFNRNNETDDVKVAGMFDFLQKKFEEKFIDHFRYDTLDGDVNQENPYNPGSSLYKQFERLRQLNEIDPTLLISGNNNLDNTANNLLALSQDTSGDGTKLGTTIINNNQMVNGNDGGDSGGDEDFFGSSLGADFSSFVPMFIEATIS
jgi:hypothetical protein